MRLNRRDFLKAGAVASTGYFLPESLARKAWAAPTPEKVVVAVYLRGGADPLSLAVPAFDPDYYTVRPDISIASGTELTLTGGNPLGFGLYPLLTDFQTMYNAGELSLVHLSGSPSESRSHFDAQDYMEKGKPDDKAIGDGWLNRYLATIGNVDSISGVSLSKTPQLALLGDSPNVAFSKISRFDVSGDFATERKAALDAFYAAEPGSTLTTGVNSAFSAVDLIAGVDTSTSITYPDNDLADALKDVAAIIKGEVGAKVFAVDLGGWDHHSNQISELVTKCTELNGAIKAFRDDLENTGGTNYLDQTVTLVMTEFGRRVEQNGGAGSDHGHGGVMFSVGGGHIGGQAIVKNNNWPGLMPDDLFKGEDLQVTTDFRDIFAEVLFSHMGASVASLEPVFPGYNINQSNFPGLF